MSFVMKGQPPDESLPGVVSRTVYEAERLKFQAETRRTSILSELLETTLVRYALATHAHGPPCDLCRDDVADLRRMCKAMCAAEGFSLGWFTDDDDLPYARQRSIDAFNAVLGDPEPPEGETL